MSSFYTPKPSELAEAHKIFEAHEPRDLFYRVATELVDVALQARTTSVTLAEALAVLLQTWNRSYYQYRKFDTQHFEDIEHVLACHRRPLLDLRSRSILRFSRQDEDGVPQLFSDFEAVLGPVGAAKCLHLLAPTFFPLWDRAIAKAYHLPIRKSGANADNYYSFMLIAQRQCQLLQGQLPTDLNPLKALDEYNYCRYTKGWI